MAFTTPCFVRVEDREERKKLIELLKRIGWRFRGIASPEKKYVVADAHHQTVTTWVLDEWGAFVKYLFKWHDPKVELPETDVEVLVMVHAAGHTYDVMRYDQHGWWQKAPGDGWCTPKYKPVGWRHIHEI